jgi:hypothetical protein
MTDITSHNLDLALLDQKVAGTFRDKRYCYTAVVNDRKGGAPWALGIAVKEEPGYHPIGGMEFDSRDAAQHVASGMNAHIGLDADAASIIVASTLSRPLKPRWRP